MFYLFNCFEINFLTDDKNVFNTIFTFMLYITFLMAKILKMLFICRVNMFKNPKTTRKKEKCVLRKLRKLLLFDCIYNIKANYKKKEILVNIVTEYSVSFFIDRNILLLLYNKYN